VIIFVHEWANISITRMVGSNTLVIDKLVLWCKSDHLTNDYFDTKDHYVKCKCIAIPTILVVMSPWPYVYPSSVYDKAGHLS
jgi:hypothetical protein